MNEERTGNKILSPANKLFILFTDLNTNLDLPFHLNKTFLSAIIRLILCWLIA